MEQRRFGKYLVQNELGAGTYARVFKALDTKLEREVAIKLLLPVLLSDQKFVGHFFKEARLSSKLQHANITPIFDVVQDSGRLFIAMGLANRGSLQEHIRRDAPLSWSDIINVTTGICSALEYAHSKGVLHRDIKPANILLHESSVWLSDFGLAEVMSDSDLSRSLSHGIIGTPSYLAPELWENEPATVASEIYALACVVFEMITGETLFRGANPFQIMRSHDKGAQFNHPNLVNVSPKIAEVLQVALSKDPALRFPNALAFLEAINQQKGSSGNNSSTSSYLDKLNVNQSFSLTLEEAYSGTTRVINMKEGERSRSIHIKIPAGVSTGVRIRVAGEGLYDSIDGIRGDLFLITNVKEHKVFQRNNDDLYTQISVESSILSNGGEAILSTLTEGRTITLRIPPNTKDGAIFRLNGQGMPKLRSEEFGDLYVTVRDKFSVIFDAFFGKTK